MAMCLFCGTIRVKILRAMLTVTALWVRWLLICDICQKKLKVGEMLRVTVLSEFQILKHFEGQKTY